MRQLWLENYVGFIKAKIKGVMTNKHGWFGARTFAYCLISLGKDRPGAAPAVLHDVRSWSVISLLFGKYRMAIADKSLLLAHQVRC